MDNEKTFEYTYSAKQQEEIEAIKKKYMPIQEDKMETLRRLDRSVERPGTIWGIVIGILGCLIMGGGMSICLEAPDKWMAVGIILGVIGMMVMAIAYPVYKFITKKRKELLAPQILALTEELSK